MNSCSETGLDVLKRMVKEDLDIIVTFIGESMSSKYTLANGTHVDFFPNEFVDIYEFSQEHQIPTITSAWWLEEVRKRNYNWIVDPSTIRYTKNSNSKSGNCLITKQHLFLNEKPIH